MALERNSAWQKWQVRLASKPFKGPKFVAFALNTFLRKVLSNAKTLNPLPPRMVTRVAQLEIAQQALAVGLGHRHGTDDSADPRRVEADRAVDDAVRSLFEFLSAMSRLPAPIGPTAEKARATFFPKDDLSFLNVEFDEEWSEIDTRLKHAEEKGALTLIEEIGGGPVVANVKKRHKEYGKALGVTTATVRATVASLQVPYARAQNSLRRYIAAAIAHGAESDVDPTVIPEAETLLAPIEEARARNAQRASRGKGARTATTRPTTSTFRWKESRRTLGAAAATERHVPIGRWVSARSARQDAT